ncbi:DUF4215 domain-containing protein [bacterium]|nr:DUF4215 domain-containing protein [bacterium]
MRIQKGLFFVAAAACMLSAWSPREASAQYGCISKVTDGAQKVLLAETKAIAGCAVSFAKGTTSQVMPCAAPFANATVKSAQDKMLADMAASCGTSLPAFGLTSLSTPPTLAFQHSVDLYKDIFGQDVNALTRKDANGLKCQDTIRKAVSSCQDTRVKEIEGCLKAASKAGTLTSVGAIADCLGGIGGNEQPDDKQKIDKACRTAIRDKVIPVCTSLGISVPVAMPGCGATDPVSAGYCVKSRSLCRICTLSNAMYGTVKDCDLADDGNDSNGSCPEPTSCGDAATDGTEQCDDANTANGDGCSSACVVETGWTCTGTSCSPIRGDGLIKGNEQCDDGNTANGDGCSSSGTIEYGFTCSGQPSVCKDACGSGKIRFTEQCDDGNKVGGDGCSATCQIETNALCGGEPSACRFKTCGEGIVDAPEACDDGNKNSGDGCSSSCTVEGSAVCTGMPSVCRIAGCGDSLIDGVETCDDGNLVGGDGCSVTCQKESGWTCGGVPSACATIPADGLVRGGEQCDDGNTRDDDGCSKTFAIETGWYCEPNREPSRCELQYSVVIDSPANGLFTTNSSTTVTGHVTNLTAERSNLDINGVIVPVAANGTFTTTVALDAAKIFNPIRVQLNDKWRTGWKAYGRTVLIRGNSIADADYSSNTIALRVNDSGLDKIEPAIVNLLGAGLDLAALLPVGSKVIDNVCVQNTFAGCLIRASAYVTNPPPSFSSFAVNLDAQNGYAIAYLTLYGVNANVRIDSTVDCGRIGFNSTDLHVDGDYSLAPDAAQANEYLDVNLIGSPRVALNGYSQNNDGSAGCNIVQFFAGNLRDTVQGALVDFLKDPDGGGPADAPVADAIETALAGLTIATTLGDALGVSFKAPFTAVIVDSAGFTFKSNARIVSSNGTGTGQCVYPPGAPKFSRTLSFTEAYPTFSGNTPGGTPYNLGFGLSATAFNQLLKTQVECGLLNLSFSAFDFGSGAEPLTAATIGALFPEFQKLPGATPVRLEVVPTIAPIVTGDVGLNGETTELRISNIIVRIVQNDGSEKVLIEGAFDARLGASFGFANGALAITLGGVDASNVTVNLLKNGIGVDQVAFETQQLPGLVASLVPLLTSDALPAIPLPAFLGFNLSGVGVAKLDKFLTVYTNLSVP